MSDEEKKAIEDLKTEYEKQSKEIERLNEILIWKQKHEEQLQKEIEELKAKNKILEAISLSFNEIQDRDKKWVDKIKVKIEEVSDGIYDAKIVLQSLLEG